MKKQIFKTVILWIVFWITVLITIYLWARVLAALSNVSSWQTLTATTWNEVISNLFWKDWWSWKIYYTGGNVGIWTSNPTSTFELKWRSRIFGATSLTMWVNSWPLEWDAIIACTWRQPINLLQDVACDWTFESWLISNTSWDNVVSVGLKWQCRKCTGDQNHWTLSIYYIWQ